MPEKSLKRAFFTIFLLVVGYAHSINHAEMGLVRLQENVSDSTQNYFDTQKKYLSGGSLRYVTFSAQAGQEDKDKQLQRHGVLYLHPNPKGTVLICHGFMCDKFDVAFMRRTLFEDYNVMMFDFRAHGENVDEDQCCTFGRDEALDVIGAVNFLKSHKDLKRLPRIGYGFSMGAVAAIQAQASDGSLFHAMVLDCPYDKSENVIKSSLQKLSFNLFGYTFEIPGRQLLEKFAFNYYVQSFLKALLKTVSNIDAVSTKTQIYPLSPVDSVKKITVPCLFIHCNNDEKVPVQAARKLYQNAAGYKRLWITNGRRHFDSIFFNPEKYIYKVNKFISSVLEQKIMHKAHAKIYSEIKL